MTPDLSSGADRGSASLELVIIAPALLIIIAVLVFAGRTEIARQAVQQAAADAARQASLALDATDARDSARTTALATLDQQNLKCTRTTVVIDAAAFTTPAGTPAKLTATVTCVINMADLAAPGIPGSRTVEASASSALDTYRQRGTSP